MNRIATEADKLIYGDYITLGDLIIDAPSKVYADGSKEVLYYFMGSRDWKTLRENATIWIDGGKLGYVNLIKFNNTANSQTPWLIKSARIKNIPNTKVIIGSLTCHGLSCLEIDGVSEEFPGLMKWVPTRKFLTGYFGIHIKNKNMSDGHGMDVSVLNGGTIKIAGFEIQYGFSGLRLASAAIDLIIEQIEINNFYIHDTVEGEGFYLGSTQSTARAKLKNLKIRNGVLARTAAESLQIQHMIGGADVRDLIIYAADTNWLCPFKAGQSTGIQWVNASGNNKLTNIIVDGFASNGYMPFGSDQDIINAPSGKSFVENILFNDGRATGMYLHNTAKYGLNWHYKNIYYRAFNNTYYERTGEKLSPYIISRKWGTDPIFFEHIVHDGSKLNVFEDVKGINIGEIILDTQMPVPKYINSGFGNTPANKIKIWHQFLAGYFPASKPINNVATVKVPTEWKLDDIAIDARADGTYGFFKCIVSHITETGTTVARPQESTYFIHLTWDENGIRNDQTGWNKNLTQSLFPPDDLRLASDCYWKGKGMGVKNIIQKEVILDDYIFDGERIVITDRTTYKTKI
jgi:hypothetical protein